MGISGIHLPPLCPHGTGLVRPECVLAHRSGTLFTADWEGRGGVGLVMPDGRTRRITATGIDFDLRPNGIALMPDATFLVTHLGQDVGGVFRLKADGSVVPVLTEVHGTPLPPTNFVFAAADEGLWITVSTRRRPRAEAYRSDVADGFIIRSDARGARVVADGLGYTNECVPTPDGRQLYVNETFARRLSAFDIGDDGALTNRRVITEFGEGIFPDGLAFDIEGHAWITSIISNRVIRVSPQGVQHLIVEDNVPAHLHWVEAAYKAHMIGRLHLDTVRSSRLRNISSLAFGGADLRTAFLGCLLGSDILSFKSPVAGNPPPHWAYDIGDILKAGAALSNGLSEAK